MPVKLDRLLQQARALLRDGDAAGAEARAGEILRQAPRHPQALCLLGVARLMGGRSAEAVAPLQQALAADPRFGMAAEHLGLAQLQLGRFADAEQVLRQAARLPGAPASVFMRLGAAILHQARAAEALPLLQRALEMAPQDAVCLLNLGQAHAQLGEMAAAEARFNEVLRIDPQHADALFNLAQLMAQRGASADARRHYEQALRFAPDMTAAHEALADMCLAARRTQEGIRHLREVLRLEPGNAGAHARLAGALFDMEALGEAEAAARRAIALDKTIADAYVALVDVYFVRGDVEHALEAIRQGVEQTQSTLLRGMLARELKRTCDWEEWAAVWQELRAEMAAGGAVSSPFSLLYQPATPREQLEYTQRWCSAQYGAIRRQRAAPRNAGQRRPRIAYLSSDLHKHAVAYLIVEVLELHDRANYEVFAFSFGPEDGSPVRARLRNACEHFIDIARDPDDVAITRIREADADIVIDLKGLTLGSRPGLLAHGLAPLQLNWLGYPGTMGAAFMDGIIADEFIIPRGYERFYSERVLRMPHCYQPNDSTRESGMPLPRAQYGLPEGGFVFCCFNQAFKISPEVFACWTRLLQRISGSVLWLLEDNPRATRNLQHALAAAGLAQERMVIAPRLPQVQHLARYKVADLALDTSPYTSHTTASDALWNGCPLAALCGETFASRVSGSILTAGGLADLITYTLDDYEDLAFRLATDRAALGAVRQRVAAARQGAPLFDSARFARDLESLYSTLLAGGAPE